MGTRTGDTSASVRTRQKARLPTVLVTTPESLSLLLTYPDAREKFAGLRCVVCDEWHELLGSKRGVLTELALARLRTFHPGLRVWGLSATVGNLDAALAVLLGPGQGGRVIRGAVPKPVTVDAVLPPRIERFPWAGHLGLTLLPQVVAAIDEGRSALVFTNTRAQSETWYRAILDARPDWAGLMALHHGSLDRKTRDWVEDHLRAGGLRCVVCTSTLDLGVDFAPVDRVIQVGSRRGGPAAATRRPQRAPAGQTSRVTCVPTHAFELVETAAPAPPRPPARSRGGSRSAGRSTYSPSTPCRRPWPAGSTRTSCSARCGPPSPTRTCRRTSGPGCSTSSPAAGRRCGRTRSTAGWWSATAGSCRRTRRWRGGTG